jgi:Protein of unknown function (DUF3631)
MQRPRPSDKRTHDSQTLWPGDGRQQRLGDYLAALDAFFCRYVAFPSEHESVAVALWVAHTYFVERFETSPLLAVTSVEMRSGKTLTLELLELVVPNPYRVVMPSEAVVYTVLSQRPRPTMLLDEADAIFGTHMPRYEGLRAILNAGNRQGAPVLRVRMDGRTHEVERFDVYGPKAIAGIGDLPGTVSDRAIPIRLKRRARNQSVARFRRREASAEAKKITFDPTLVTLVPDVPVPDELNDRAADSWEPLIAIAEAAGEPWPERARLAAIALSRENLRVSSGVLLLGHIRDAFSGEKDHLPTAELLRSLHDRDDAQWFDWYGAPLSAQGLAKLLDRYGIRPAQRRVGGEKVRGYFKADFADAWARYLEPQAAGTSGTTGTMVE